MKGGREEGRKGGARSEGGRQKGGRRGMEEENMGGREEGRKRGREKERKGGGRDHNSSPKPSLYPGPVLPRTGRLVCKVSAFAVSRQRGSSPVS